MILVGKQVENIVKRIFSKKHPILAEIIINWPQIIGSSLSNIVHPIKITSYTEKKKKINILHVQVQNSSIALQFSFQQEIIIERIAIYLGFKAIHSIKIHLTN